MKATTRIFGVLALASSLSAALTEEQRVQDFQAVSGLYAKSYAPANWKIQSLGINIFETGDWLKRIRAAKNDLEHAQILLEYVASFKDTHTSASMQSNFVADLGFYCDLYDGKILIDQIDRSLLPMRDYPLVAGDELVSIDGVPSMSIAEQLRKLEGWGNPRAALRYAIQDITFRQQSSQPLAVDLPDQSDVVFRKADGTMVTYKLKWTKSGLPIRNLGVAASPRTISTGLQFETSEVEPVDAADPRPAFRRLYYDSRQAKVARARVRPSRAQVQLEDGSKVPFEALRGFGSRAPIWSLPTGFVQRLGRGASDYFFSGTYVSDGQRIGYLRIPDFGFSTTAQLQQMYSEIQFFNNNTDGLVVDVMRNPGGFVCSAVNAMTIVNPGVGTQIGFSIRPSLAWIQDYDSALLESEFFEDPQYVIDTLKFQRDLIVAAFNNGRGLTGSLPLCGLDFPFNGQRLAYSKPMITLVDDFTTSGGDAFAAMVQDNKRGKLVGTRTNGAGGTVIDLDGSPWSETLSRLTESVMVRSVEREYEGFGKSTFVENVGVRPDLELDYMTAENLSNSGRPFVAAFTKLLVDEIRAAKP